MSKLIYLFFIKLYPLVIKLVSPFNKKARLWINGRKNIFTQLRASIQQGDKVIWMHCASLGEFEQGRPILEKLHEQYANHKILLTFFSPSGYEVRKNYEKAHYVFYLPMDSRRNALEFFEIVQPVMAIFVKYEYWYHYLTEAKNRHIPLILISAIFRKDQPFFKPVVGDIYRKMLHCFTTIFVQNQESVQLLASIGHTTNIILAGDTRFDRVAEIAERFTPIPIAENFTNGQNVIVAGSTWLEDDKELAHFANSNPNVKFIIAPHSIQSARIRDCLTYYKNAILYSQLLQEPALAKTAHVLIIDNIGMLSSLYKYATIGYIGGGFGHDGVHNVLEAAVYGIPVVFGPEYDKYYEARELIDTGAATSIETALELETVLQHLLIDKNEWGKQAIAATNYVYNNRGATETILQNIYEKRLLTN